MHTHLMLALIGALGGLVSGAAGLGGGIVLVPAIVALLGREATGEAIMVSLFAVLLNSLSATLQNRKARGAVDYWRLVRGARWYTAGAAAMALLVALAVGQHHGVVSKQTLGGLQLLLVACMLVPRRWYEHLRARHGRVKDTAFGSMVGGVSALIGVGGGTYTMCYFLVHGRPIKDCTLTCNFVGIFVGLMGVVGYCGLAPAAGTHVIDALGKTLLIAAGVAASPLGVKLQARLSAALIRNAVVGLLAVSSTWVLVGA